MKQFYILRRRKRFTQLILGTALLFSLSIHMVAQHSWGNQDHSQQSWQQVVDHANWPARAGLQVVKLNDQLYLMGGRTPLESDIFGESQMWSDVWKSNLSGKKWRQILTSDQPDHWPARAYFQAVTMGKYMYLLGGQNFRVIPNPNPYPQPGEPEFISISDFFNDVWRSRDGIHWRQIVPNAPWHGRAGFSCVVFKNEIYVMAGSFNDDVAIIGGQPQRVYFNDVWKSKDGKHWQKLTDEAPWAPRAGAIATVKNGYIYLIGGEDNFTCIPGGRCPPYYNDVWRSRNGKDWELITAEAPWSPRPGHQVLVYQDQFVLFGGFGLNPEAPFIPANPMDVWMSKNGVDWKKLKDTPWQAKAPTDVKYDFDALVVPGAKWGMPPAILTFGGDRETFNPGDPFNYLNVDNDVWRFTPSYEKYNKDEKEKKHHPCFIKVYPNPFTIDTKINYLTTKKGKVSIIVYNALGAPVRHLINGFEDEGEHSCMWDGKDNKNKKVRKGIYYARLVTQEHTDIIRIILK